MNFLIGGGNSLRKFRAIKFFVVYSVIGSLFILAALMIIIKNFGFFPTIAYLKYSS